MATNQKIVQTPAVALYSGLSTTGTSFTITPYPVDLDGTKLAMTDFGTTGYATIDPKVSGYEEIVSFTGITDNGNNTATLTGVTRDLTSKFPYTTAGTGKQHGASAVVVFSNNPQVYAAYGAKANDEAITGFWTVPTPVSPTGIATKAYADSIAAGTGPAASQSAMGLTKLSYNPQTTLGTATVTIATPAVVTFNSHGLIAGDMVKLTTTGALPTGLVAGTTYFVIAAGLTANAFELAATLGGTAINTTGTQSGTHTLFRMTPFAVVDNDPRIFPNAYGIDAGVNDTYAITLATAPIAYVAGQVYSFKANTANTGAATLNVNGLGAITIKKGSTTDLSDNDILAGMYVFVLYDGTNFQVVGRSLIPSIDVQVFLTSGTWTKPTGAQYVEITLIGCGGGGASGQGNGATAGGPGGGGGGFTTGKVPASILGSTVAVTVVNAGGVGGIGASGSSTSITGTAGSDTTFGTFFKAGGGAPGTNAGGGVGGTGTIPGGNGGAAGAVGTATSLSGSGGAGGGAANTIGGVGGAVTGIPRVGGTAGSGGGTPGVGGAGVSAAAGEATGGSGGGGGGGTNQASTPGGVGGAGGSYGGGGGGGGCASGSGSPNPGNGGQGGPAVAVVITYK